MRKIYLLIGIAVLSLVLTGIVLALSVCGDGYCGGSDIGEDCKACPGDCPGVTTGEPSGRYCCGNYVCETVGENVENCPIDCVAVDDSPYKDVVSYPFQGIKRTHRTTTNPRPLNMNILEVDLTNPGISLLVTPPNPDRTGPDDEVLARKTSTFVDEFNVQAGINGDFSSTEQVPEYEPRGVEGLAVSNGVQYSDDAGRPALTFSQSNESYIGWAPFPSGVYNAVGGNKMLVENGQPVDPATWDPIGGALEQNPRTSVGISKDGAKLIIIVIDGRQPGFSEGVTLPEMAEYLIEFGAYTGLNFDGGGSSTLVFEGPIIINYPSDVEGERVVVNHLGIYAASTIACSSDAACDDANECTADTCIDPGTASSYCQNTPVADNTACAGGVCCSGICKAPACLADTDCNDNNACTQDTCNNAGTCAASCSYTSITSCTGGDGCCPAGCSYPTDSDCPQTIKCWKGTNLYLYQAADQAKKFCKCAQGSYGYNSYKSNRATKTVWKYIDPADNENWQVTSTSSKTPVYSVICTDSKAYLTNQDYSYPK